MDNVHKTRHSLTLVVALLCSLTACSHRTSHELRSQHLDKVLFHKAMTAVQQKRFTVANLNLQTLVNTYPDSEYADQAKLMLRDPRIARCGGGFSNTPTSLCDTEVAAAH